MKASKLKAFRRTALFSGMLLVAAALFAYRGAELIVAVMDLGRVA